MMRALAALVAVGVLPAQDVPDAVFERIRRDAFASDRAHADLLHLCDRIGGRLTGSEAHLEAGAFVSSTALDAGLGVRLGAVPVPVTWRRGAVQVAATQPFGRQLAARAAAWTPGFGAAVCGVVLVDPAPDSDVEGRIVLVDPIAVPLVPRQRHPFRDAALVLIDGRRPLSLVPTGLATWAGPFVPSSVPAAFLAATDAAWIRRLTAAGEEVQLEVRGGGVLGEAAEVGDVLVELPGVGEEGLAEEVVLAAVGLDSWDVGTGAVADAAGVAVVLEAARLLARLDGRPLRTIRFAFLAGTAQGLGTLGYSKRLDDQQAARHIGGFVLEGGGGRLLGLHLEGSVPHLEPAERWFAPVRFLGVTDIGFRSSPAGVARALQERGIPVFAFVQEAPELAWIVGTTADTPDRIVAQDLQQAACVLATGLWNLANGEEVPPRLAR